MITIDHISAHEHSSRHREELTRSEQCGCFYCLAIFEPSAVNKWIDGQTTAMCPQCGIDSVIGSASGYPITKDFLAKMQEYWFGEGAPRK
jgi:hypothetical protein